MTETTFKEAVVLVGRLPSGQERNDLIAHGKLWPELWKWSPYTHIPLEKALEAHEKHGGGYLIVRRPAEKVINKRPRLPEQKSIRLKPPAPPAPTPAPTTIVETIPASLPEGPNELPSEEKVPAFTVPSPGLIPYASENPAGDLSAPTSESTPAETTIAEAAAIPESSEVPSMGSPPSQAVPQPITAPLEGLSEPIQDAEVTSSQPVNGMPPLPSADNGEIVMVAALEATAAPSQTAQRPQPENFGRHLNRLYLLVVWFVASSGVFAYFLGRFTELGVAWVVGYWMVTIAVAILLWAASTWASSSR